MTAKTERLYPIVAGLVAAIGFFVFLTFRPIPETVVNNLLLAVINISAIAVGFLATAKSILISIEKKRIMDQLRRAGYYHTLVDFLMTAVRWSLFVAVLSAALLLLDWKYINVTERVALGVWLCAVATAFLACYRVIHIFGKLLQSDD